MGKTKRKTGATEVALATAKAKLEPPAKYQVWLLNDDYTPMDFVVEVLQKFFGMDLAKATYTMLQVHTKGKGICGIYSRDLAETKVALVTEYSLAHEHPLKCQLEAV